MSITLRVQVTAPQNVDTELLIVGVFQNSLQTGVAGLLDSSCGGLISTKAAADRFTGKTGEISLQFIGRQHQARHVLFLGLGAADKLSMDKLRDALVAAFKEAKRLKVSRVAFAELNLPGSKIDICDYARLIAETGGLVDYVINHFKTERGGHTAETRLSEITVLAPLGQHQALQAALNEGRTIASNVNHARNLVNLPPSTLTPRALAEYAKRVELDSNGTVKVVLHEKAELEQLGAGAFLAVSRGSDQDPVLIEMSYLPAEADPSVTLAFIGKSVTFDSGGLDLKPADGMRNMKCDMAGGAATLAAIATIAALRLPVRVRVFMAATENMTGGDAYKPGDVLTSLAGLTVEIDNTDAEGRLTLADAIEFARRQGVTHIVDIATLTGAVRTCCGNLGAGAFSNTPAFLQEVIDAGARNGELMAALPFWEGLARANESQVADLKNSGGSAFGAGSATAAWFLRRFAADTPWVHLDVASVAFRDSALGVDPAGGTGWGVRTLVELARSFSHTERKQK